jgi:hypothetical protein
MAPMLWIMYVNWDLWQVLRFKFEEEWDPAVDIVKEVEFEQVEVVSYQYATFAVTGLDNLIFSSPPLIATIDFKPSMCTIASDMHLLPFFSLSADSTENIVPVTYR